MVDTERLRAAFEYLRKNKVVRNQQDFVERIGSDKSTVSQIFNGHIQIPNILFGKVVEAFPQFSEEWLRFGEGEMLKPGVQQISYGDMSPNLNGKGNSVNFVTEDLKIFVEELSAQRRISERTLTLLEKKDEQIDRLISIIEKQK